MKEAVGAVALTDANKRTFFARFLRSLRNLRDALSTLVSRPDYKAAKRTFAMLAGQEVWGLHSPVPSGTWVQTSSASPRYHKSTRSPCSGHHQSLS